MGDDIKRASIGLILLFMVGTIHRYAAFSNNATSLGQILSNNAPLEMSMISSPSESQFSEDIDRQKGRIAALKAQNQQLREEQEKMLAAVSNPATFAPPTIDSGSHLRGERKLATPQSIPQQNIPSTVPSNSLMVESEGWSGALRGSGLGELASAALAKATSSLTSQEAAPQIVPSSSTESSSNQLTGSYVSFQSARSKQFLSLDEKHWVVPSLDGTFPLASRVFKVEDVGAGWVALQCADKQMYLEMVPKTQPLAWVVRGSHGESGSLNIRQHWRLEGGRLFNRESESYVNLIGEANAVRGHGNAPNKRSGAGPEPTTLFTVSTVDTQALAGDAKKQQVVKTVEADTEKAYREAIQAFPKSNEKRVVSYGLYGSNPKYTVGAIRNAELVKVWFPGWVARFYCDNTVPANIIKTLKDLDAEIVTISDIKGGIAGMFWRFLVADDDTVDRYIIRDTDSRLNPRERFAVEDWIRSGKGVHSIRDHPNHERPLNGGLWGGTKGSVKGITQMVKKFSNKGKYGGDLTFLNEKVWPQIRDNQISHDAYSCKKFPNAHPFPTKRPSNYQHVGQVFFEDEKFRAGDINGFMRGREVPQQCRKNSLWKYG